jgi:hypothetical protein
MNEAVINNLPLDEYNRMKRHDDKLQRVANALDNYKSILINILDMLPDKEQQEALEIITAKGKYYELSEAELKSLHCQVLHNAALKSDLKNKFSEVIG